MFMVVVNSDEKTSRSCCCYSILNRHSSLINYVHTKQAAFSGISDVLKLKVSVTNRLQPKLHLYMVFPCPPQETALAVARVRVLALLAHQTCGKYFSYILF